jgi:hypothetical protein
MTVGTALSSLMALCGKSSVDTSLPVGMVTGAREAIRAASEEARIIAPSLFGRRQRVTLAGPEAISFNLAADLTTFYNVTGAIPGVGCTLLLEGSTYHNTIASLGTVTDSEIIGVSGTALIDDISPNGLYYWDGLTIYNGHRLYRNLAETFEFTWAGGWQLHLVNEVSGAFWFNDGEEIASAGAGFYQPSGGGATGGPLNVVNGGTVQGGTLDRAAVGSSGPRIATVWNDCWAPSNGAVRILADITANGGPISVLRGPEELHRLVESSVPFSQGYPIIPTTYDVGTNSTVVVPDQFPENTRGGYRTPYQGEQVIACWPDDFAPSGVRLRFAPMPGEPMLIELVTVAFPDTTNDSADLLMPNGLDSLVLVPLAQWHWMRSSWFKPETRQAAAIREEYGTALRRLTNHGPSAGFIGRG